jgi:hypothetical protein
LRFPSVPPVQLALSLSLSLCLSIAKLSSPVDICLIIPPLPNPHIPNPILLLMPLRQKVATHRRQDKSPNNCARNNTNFRCSRQLVAASNSADASTTITGFAWEEAVGVGVEV